LKRWPLGTSYVTIVRDLSAMVAQAPLKGSVIAADETGVGKPVVDMLRAVPLKASVRGILITSGHEETPDGAGWHVPQKNLVGVLQVLLQSQRLRVAKCEEREALIREFSHFKVKVTAAANETYEAWRERDRDDLVLVVALACWLGERLPRKETGGQVPY